MGQPVSSPQQSLGRGAVLSSDSGIFESGYDELAIKAKFEYDAERESGEDAFRFLPPNLLSEILCDPTVYTTAETAEEIWSDVILPMYRSGDKPETLEFLGSLFKFMKDRVTPFSNAEVQRRAEKERVAQGVQGTIVDVHAKPVTESPRVRNMMITSSIVMSGPERAMKDLTLFDDKDVIIDTRETYGIVSAKMMEQLEQNPTYGVASACFKWGVFSGDLACIINAMSYLGKIALNRNAPVKKDDIKWSSYKSLVEKLRVKNAVWLPTAIVNPPNCVIPNFKVPEKKTISIGCDTDSVYVMGHKIDVTAISMSRNWANDESRFSETKITSDDNLWKTNMVIAGKYSLVVDLESYLICSLPMFVSLGRPKIVHRKNGKRSGTKPCTPMASDGKFIYCLNTKKKMIVVFSISDDGRTLFVERKLAIHSRIPVPSHSYCKDLLPQLLFPVYCNGVAFTIVMYEPTNQRTQQNVFNYMFRSFSVLDGSYIGDYKCQMPWPILAVTTDPWNRVAYVVSRDSESVKLVKMPMYCSHPAWIGGFDINWLASIDVVQQLSSIKTAKDAFTAVLRLMSYYSTHLFGASFKAVIGTKVDVFHGELATVSDEILGYDVITAKFFGNCTSRVIDMLMAVIKEYIGLHKTASDENKPLIKNMLVFMMQLLDYNVSNFSNRKAQNEEGVEATQSVVLENIEGLREFLLYILEKKDVKFIHQLAAFITVNAFSTLYKRIDKCSAKLFLKVYTTMPDDFRIYMINELQANPRFPYAFSKDNCREIFSPILQKMANKETVKPVEHELIACALRSLMLEMKSLYEKYPTKLPDDAQALSDAFVAFSNVIAEEAGLFFSDTDNIKSMPSVWVMHPFIRIFMKWLIVLQPFSDIHRASHEATSFLQPVLKSLTRTLKTLEVDMNINSEGGVSDLQLLFYEIFSLYVNFINAFIDGGMELKNTSEYTWLVRATIESGLTPKDITDLLFELDSDTPGHGRKLLKKGFSFSIMDKYTPSTEIESFAKKLSGATIIEECAQLMNFLYTKVSNPLNRKLTDEDKRIERLLLAVFMKQFGFSAEIFELSMLLRENPKANAPLSTFTKQAMQSIYRIRRRLRESRQATARRIESLENSMMLESEDIPLEENYDLYVSEMMKKAVFLLHVQPCMRFESVDITQTFPSFLKKIESFLASSITVEDYFNKLVAAKSARKEASLGAALINSLLDNGIEICNDVIIDRFAASTAIPVFIQAIEDEESEPMKQTLSLLHTVEKLISTASNSSLRVLIVFAVNMIKPLMEKNADLAGRSIVNLLQCISDLKPKKSKEDFEKMIGFAAGLINIVGIDKIEVMDPEIIEKIRQFIFRGKSSVDFDNLSLVRMAVRTGVKIAFDDSDYVRFLSCGPEHFHVALSYVYDMMQTSDKCIDFISYLLRDISNGVSGHKTMFMSDAQDIESSGLSQGDMIRSPIALLGGCIEMIQVCRRILNGSGELSTVMRNIMSYILRRWSPENPCDRDPKYSQFDDSMLLYGVFAILSNVIEAPRKYCLLRDEDSGVMYYIEDIDSFKQIYRVWSLPITAYTCPQELRFSASLVPVSIMPFTTAMFCDTDVLIPYFKKQLVGEPFDCQYLGLGFMILASLREYIQDRTILDKIMALCGKMQLETVSYGNSNEAIMKVIHCHLAQNGGGFRHTIGTNIGFHDFSPSNIGNRRSIDDVSMSSSAGIAMFISDWLPCDSMSTLAVNIRGMNYDIGLYSPTIEGSGSNQVLLSVRRSVVGKRNEYAPGRYVVRYDPLFGGAIYDDHSKKLSKTVVFKERSAVCFLVVMYDQCSAEYKLQTNRDSLNVLSSGTTMIRKVPKITDKTDLLQRFRKPTLQVKTTSKITRDRYTASEPSGEKLCVPNPGYRSDTILLTYPHDVLAMLSTSLECSPKTQASSVCFPVCVPDDKQNNEVEIVDDSLRRVTGHRDLILKYVYGDTPFIDPVTGIVTTEPEYDVESKLCKILPRITPFEYNWLPVHILNYLMKGYTNMAIAESKTALFLQLMSKNDIPVETTLNWFNIDMENLVRHLIRMLVYIEPVKLSRIGAGPSPVDFGVDITGDEYQIPVSLSMYHQAIQRIYQYILSSNQLHLFADAWHTILENQFGDPYSHSALENNPNVVIRALSEISSPFIYNRQEVDCWVVMRASPMHLNAPMCQVNGVDLMDNIILCNGSEFEVTFSTKADVTFAAIPVKYDDHSSFAGTFIELLVSMKYFIYLLVQKIPANQHGPHRVMIFENLVKCFVARSPCFIQYVQSILQFVEGAVPLVGSDMKISVLKSMNLLALYCNHIPRIKRLLEEKKVLYDERVLIPFKAHFREFCTKEDIANIESSDEEMPFVLPTCPWPEKFTKGTDSKVFTDTITNLKRIMRDNVMIGFPVQLIVHYWAEAFKQLLPFSVEHRSPRLVEIRFTAMTPSRAKLVVGPNIPAIEFKLGSGMKAPKIRSDTFFDVADEVICLELVDANTSWSDMRWTLVTEVAATSDQIIRQFRDVLVADMREWLGIFNLDVDMTLLDCIKLKSWQCDSMELVIDPVNMLYTSIRSIPIRLAMIRSQYLMMINWLSYQHIMDAGDHELDCLTSRISPVWKVEAFRNEVCRRSPDTDRPDFYMKRLPAMDVRDGTSNNLRMTYMYQLTNKINDHAVLRRDGSAPWRISYSGENGIDAGGLAREFFSEVVDDLCCPNCRLVVAVPNGQNQVGDFRECVVPSPDQGHDQIEKQYKTAGALIGMAIRTGLTQCFAFPPLVWHYLIDGTISIERIYEIDENFQTLIASLEEALGSGMDENTFSSRFSLTFAIKNSAGVECPLKQRGKVTAVTLSNCRQFISLAKELRVNEHRKWLECMREGLLENIMFNATELSAYDWRTLKLAACGSDDISTEDIKARMLFVNIPAAQEAIFWTAVEQMSQHQRVMLLKFWTGSKRLPTSTGKYLKIDHEGTPDNCPTSSTCFFTLHLPQYSNAEIAFIRIVAAAENTGTFENT